jgi:voltage-gated potassium channel
MAMALKWYNKYTNNQILKMPNKKSKKMDDKTKLILLFYKELIFTVLALMSVFLLAYEYLANPVDEVVAIIYRFDLIVAMIFLIDFFTHLYLAKNRKHYFIHNWYFLLASIPLVDTWTESLRALRILGLIRLVRAAEHIKYSTEITKHAKR